MKVTFLGALALLVFSSFAAAQQKGTGAAVESAPLTLDARAKSIITARIEAARPGIVVSEVEPSFIKNLYRTKIENGPVVYATIDGKYFITGEMYEVTSNEIVNLSQKEMNKTRKKLLDTVDTNEMIVFSPKGEPKAVVSIFTDVDCGYCQKLHREINQYTALGIEVRYMAFPRAGIQSEAYNKIASAWCAKDRNEALTKLKAGENIPNNVCANNPVAKQYRLGSQMGISGTPAVILMSGELIPGYVPADQLALRLGI